MMALLMCMLGERKEKLGTPTDEALQQSVSVFLNRFLLLKSSGRHVTGFLLLIPNKCVCFITTSFGIAFH